MNRAAVSRAIGASPIGDQASRLDYQGSRARMESGIIYHVMYISTSHRFGQRSKKSH